MPKKMNKTQEPAVEPPVVIKQNGVEYQLVQQPIPKTKEITPKDTPTSPKKFQFTYQQMKKVYELFEQKTGLKFWINLSKEEQEAEKATPSDREYHRLAYTMYNGFPLFNVVRYHPDRTRVPKSKAYAVFNLKSMKCSMNSQNKIEFDEAEIKIIKDTLNLEEKKD